MSYWGYVRGLLIALILGGCGGGGGGGTNAAPQLLGRFEVSLSGAEESVITDADATGFFSVRLVDDGTLQFWVGVQPAWVAEVSAMHIHRGAAGSDGPIEIDLLGAGSGFDPATASATGTLSISPALAAEIAADPDAFYVNVHTNAAPGGLVRGQLTTATTREWHVEMRGDEEPVLVDADARGAATFRVASDGRIEFVVAMASPAIVDLISGHIHVGESGVAGGIVVDLDLGSASRDVATGTLTGAVQTDPATLARIITGLDAFYVNVHTNAAPAGIVRGQLASGTVEFWAAPRGDEETTPVDPNARGGMSLEVFAFDTGLATLAVPPAQGIANITAAHVHQGRAGADGGVVIDLLAGADFNRSGPTGSADGTVVLTQALLTRMLADPDAFYTNFHTATAPNGLVRGQLSRAPETFFGDTDGDEETNVVDPDAAGTVSIVLANVHECSFSISMTQPDLGELTAAHLHDGVAGANGPVLVDFLNGSDVQTSSAAITGRAVVSGRTFARLLAAAELFYFNVHSVAAPAGIARGQARRLSGDLPPSALSYDTPVTYQTAVTIANNTPVVAGGAVAGYSVTPPLPAGLALNTVTGVIGGRPTAAAAQADYIVTATNSGGSTSATITITVNLSAPTSLSYGGPRTFVTGTLITPLNPFSQGGAITSYAVAPALPSGLSLNGTTGVISGTPSVAAAQANYLVTASNSAGSVQANANITVTAALQPPSSLSYSSPVVYPTGTAITANSPTVSGGAVATWSISTSLPAGLAFSTSTGVISGTPTAVTAQANYLVTATNAAGSTTATVTLTVALGAPTSLSYSPNSSLGYVTGGTFTSMNPSSSGGAVSSYSISPALPSGVSISTSTGVISGSPTATSSQTSYTVTATNSAGSTTATVLVTVLP